MTGSTAGIEAPVRTRLTHLDRFLPLWIGLAIVGGLFLGRAIPSLNDLLDAVKVGPVSLPIAIGLFAMMYPVLAKVDYRNLRSVTQDLRFISTSLFFNWLVGPAVMFSLAWWFLADYPAFRTGVILVGLARCIAMVLVWNDIALGNREAAAVLVALNALFQVAFYSVLGYFYLQLLPSWLGWETTLFEVSFWEIAGIVLIFLGIPLAAGYATRVWGEARRGRDWYERQLLPRLGRASLWGLLFTVVVLFALQGETITAEPGIVARIALPLFIYFVVMWGLGFGAGRLRGLPYDRTVTLAFTAGSNDFELAIAVAIGVFGVTSGEALAGVIGPLIEVPVLIGLVYVALWIRRRFYPHS